MENAVRLRLLLVAAVAHQQPKVAAAEGLWRVTARAGRDVMAESANAVSRSLSISAASWGRAGPWRRRGKPTWVRNQWTSLAMISLTLRGARDLPGASRDHDTHRLHAMAPGLVGQTIEQAAGHPRMRAVGAAAKARPAICGQGSIVLGGGRAWSGAGQRCDGPAATSSTRRTTWLPYRP